MCCMSVLYMHMFAYKYSSAYRRPAKNMYAPVFFNEVLSWLVSLKLVTWEEYLG